MTNPPRRGRFLVERRSVTLERKKAFVWVKKNCIKLMHFLQLISNNKTIYCNLHSQKQYKKTIWLLKIGMLKHCWYVWLSERKSEIGRYFIRFFFNYISLTSLFLDDDIIPHLAFLLVLVFPYPVTRGGELPGVSFYHFSVKT